PAYPARPAVPDADRPGGRDPRPGRRRSVQYRHRTAAGGQREDRAQPRLQHLHEDPGHLPGGGGRPGPGRGPRRVVARGLADPSRSVDTWGTGRVPSGSRSSELTKRLHRWPTSRTWSPGWKLGGTGRSCPVVRVERGAASSRSEPPWSGGGGPAPLAMSRLTIQGWSTSLEPSSTTTK